MAFDLRIAALIALSALACRAEVRVSGVPPLPAKPAQDSSTTMPKRTTFQTRSPIRFAVSATVLLGGDHLSITDATTRSTLVPPVPLDDGHMLGPVSGSRFSVEQDPTGNDLLVGLFILGASPPLLAYGTNQIFVEGGATGADGSISLMLHDFPVQSAASTSFVSGHQVAQGFQGWMAPVTQPIAGGSDGSQLAVGFEPIVNQ